MGMQRLAPQSADGFLFLYAQDSQSACHHPSIRRIPDDRMTDGGHVHADLMGAARFQATFHDREIP